METIPNIPRLSPLSWVPVWRSSIRYGMWFDGSNDTVLVDGSSFNGKTTGKITGVFQTTSTGIVCVCAATDETDVNSDLRINISSGKLQFAVRQAAAHGVNVTTDATYNDGAAHTFEVKVTDSGNFITVDGVLLGASELTYLYGSASSHVWFSDVVAIDRWAIGVRQEAVPDNNFLGVVRDIIVYDEDTTTVLGHWAGHGNTNADWLDKGGTGNVGTWFDGVNDEVCLGNSAAFNYTTDLDFTITFVTPNPSVAQTLISKGNMSTETCWAADISGGVLRFFGYTSGSSVRGIVSGGPAVVANTLYTARFTFDGTTWKIFVDGVEEKSVTSAATLRTNTEDVCIGSRSGDIKFFDGVIRDVVVKIDEALVGTWNGYGNTDAEWEDQVGSNDGEVAGSPSRALSTATGWRKENHGTVSGSPSRAISEDGGTTWAEET